MTALTVVSTTGSARAQTPSTHSSYGGSTPTTAPMGVDAPAVTPIASADPLTTNSTPPVERSAPIYAPLQTAEPAATPATTVDPLATNPTVPPIPEQTAAQPQGQQANYPDLNPYQADAQRRQAAAMDSNEQPAPQSTADVSTANPLPREQQASPQATAGVNTAEPMPGTVSTSAAHLTEQPRIAPLPEVSSEQADTSVAQNLENIEPGRATRGGRSYIGIGGNLGLSGGTGIGQGGFLINSKIGLTRNISARPSVIIGDDTDFLIPLTYDFVLESADPFQPIPFAPFVGGGIAFSTDGDNNVGFLLTGGADFPLSRQFVANATVNAGFFGDTTSIGIAIGVGYQFSGF